MITCLAAADWGRFLGQLHPVLVHLPIGSLAVLRVVELLCIRRQDDATFLRREKRDANGTTTKSGSSVITSTAVAAVAQVVAVAAQRPSRRR